MLLVPWTTFWEVRRSPAIFHILHRAERFMLCSSVYREQLRSRVCLRSEYLFGSCSTHCRRSRKCANTERWQPFSWPLLIKMSLSLWSLSSSRPKYSAAFSAAHTFLKPYWLQPGKLFYHYFIDFFLYFLNFSRPPCLWNFPTIINCRLLMPWLLRGT